MIDFYTAATPNGQKISIVLEEMSLPYKLINVDLRAEEQKTAEFLKMNPNGRIPVIVDHDNDDFVLFESGAILVYLAEKTGLFYGQNEKQRYEILQWVMFQMSGIGPMMGQANVFHRYFPEKIEVVINRYQNEVKRLFGVLNSRLTDNEYLVGDYSIADIANWAWVRTHEWSGVETDDLPHLSRWIELIAARPAAEKGINIPPRGNAEQIVKSGQAIIQK
ncbi:MAG TPA: glutathione S-transferase family protein [Aeromonadales bacterium]|nr:glutathione S-transferase family protein [Aeromonadales bacterium]